MDGPDYVTCPSCGSERAVVAYRTIGRVAHYCPECEHSWDRHPSPQDAPQVSDEAR
jgi:rubredoxin